MARHSGSGSGTVSGQTPAFLPLATGSTSIGKSSPLSVDDVTTPTKVSSTVPYFGTIRDKGGLVYDVKAYGATATGVLGSPSAGTDDAPFFRTAGAAILAAGGGTLHIPPGVYRLTSNDPVATNTILYLRSSHVHIECDKGAVLYSTATNQNLFVLGYAGPAYQDLNAATRYPFTAIQKPGATSVTFTTHSDASNFSVGDAVYLMGGPGQEAGGDSEINWVKAVDSGAGTVTLVRPTVKPYNTDGTGSYYTPGSPLNIAMANANNSLYYDESIEGCEAWVGGGYFFGQGQVVGVKVRNNTVHQLTGGVTYGLFMNYLYPAADIEVSGNTYYGDPGALQSSAQMAQPAYGVRDVSYTNNVMVTNQTALNPSQGASNVLIANNRFYVNKGSLIGSAITTSQAYGVRIANNEFVYRNDGGSPAGALSLGLSNGSCINCTVTGNTIIATGNIGDTVGAVGSDLIISGNDISTDGGGINLADRSTINQSISAITGNKIHNTNSIGQFYGISINGSRQVVVGHNIIWADTLYTGGGAYSAIALLGTGAAGGTIVGNEIRNFKIGIKTQSGDSPTLSSNTCTNVTTATNCNTPGVALTAANNTFSGANTFAGIVGTDGTFSGNVAANTAALGGLPLAADVSYTGLNVYGDSFGLGYGASVHTTYGYAYLLQRDFGGTFNNQSISGARAPDLSTHMFNAAAPSYTSNAASVIELGHNDAACGVTTGCENNYTHEMTALIAYRAIPLQYQIQFGSAPAATCTTTGTWTADTETFVGYTALAGLALQTIVPASTITCTTLTSSPYLYLGWYARDGFTASASISINSGAVTDTLNAFGFNSQIIQSGLGTTQTVFANRYFVSGGITTFTITVNTAGAGNKFSLYFAGSPMPSTSTAMANLTENPPRVFVTGTGYLPGFTTPDSSIAAYDTLNYNLASQFAADGFFVKYVNLRNPTNTGGIPNGPLNNSTDYAGGTLANGQVCPATADAYHPNNCGHQHLRDAIVAVSRPIQSFGNGPSTLLLGQVQVSANYTIQPGVDGIVYQNCNACTVTLPDALPTSGPIWIINDGTNSFTIAAAAGATKQASVPSTLTPNTAIGVVSLLSAGHDFWGGFTQVVPSPFALSSAACSYMKTTTSTGTAQSFLAGSGPGEYLAVNRDACTGAFGDTAKTAAYMVLNATAGGTTSNIQFATGSTANSTPSVTHTFDNTGINLASGLTYKVNSVAGVTKTCSTAITAMTVVGGIITSLTCP
jgi:hypothetical protein